MNREQIPAADWLAPQSRWWPIQIEQEVSVQRVSLMGAVEGAQTLVKAPQKKRM